MSSPDDYELGPLIGKGAFSQVYKLIRRSDGKEFAVKQIDLYKSDGQEIAFLQNFDSPFIVKYVESFKDAHCLYIIMEFCEHGNLREFIQETKAKGLRVSEEKAWQFLASATVGLNTLHVRGVIHRDLKPENFFLDARFNAKIGDLGVARELHSPEEMAQTRAGTPLYFSPEVNLMEKYTQPADIYSLGVCLLELLTLEQCNPFLVFSASAPDSSKPSRPYDDILKECLDKISSEYSDTIKELLFHMLARAPDKRPTAQQILDSPRVAEEVKKLESTGLSTAATAAQAGTIVPTMYDASKSVDGSEPYIQSSSSSPSGVLFQGPSMPFFAKMQSPTPRYSGADLPRIHAALKKMEYPPMFVDDDAPERDDLIDRVKKNVVNEISALATALSSATEKHVKQLVEEGFYQTMTRFLSPCGSEEGADQAIVSLICRCCVYVWNFKASIVSPFQQQGLASAPSSSSFSSYTLTKEQEEASEVKQFVERLLGELSVSTVTTTNYILTAVHRFLQQSLPTAIARATEAERDATIKFCRRLVRKLNKKLDSTSGEVVERAVKMMYLICIRTMSVSSGDKHPLFDTMNALPRSKKGKKYKSTMGTLSSENGEEDENDSDDSSGDLGNDDDDDEENENEGKALLTTGLLDPANASKSSGIQQLVFVCETTPNDEVKLYAAICLVHLFQMQKIPSELTFTVDTVMDKVKRQGEWVTNCLGALRTLAGKHENHSFLLTDQFFNHVPNLLNGSYPVVGHTFSVLFALVKFGEHDKAKPFIKKAVPDARLQVFVNHPDELVKHNARKLEAELKK
ncbi:putative NEK kinase [Monocercomonoides exilis]|uniref:putative NEK kinase n=1 Tax=Monocercomonoides exilis TaxID=2049356 RepID=UPI00355A617F|nr:putative NEK kinase [Monocercomonoides exilis]|eukprot:MONOS_11358.1-p1 / transcript=MONOS_11358.1 / gene=MONOS_11358 / organism=Monocercomonoides_exilis_PA203 / gene_product=serine / transcript_product=serine / location=Mono_scaffold00565:32096-35177(+) / protein_length=800 / sequence_SO=supercontig / SO=protein_coding / is_pseudo=false